MTYQVLRTVLDKREFDLKMRSQFVPYNGYDWNGEILRVEFNEIISPEDKSTIESMPLSIGSTNDLKQKGQRIFGSTLSPSVIDLIGSRTLETSAQDYDFDGLALAQVQIKSFLEVGDLRSATNTCQTLIDDNTYSNHTDIFQYCVDQITNFLSLQS